MAITQTDELEDKDAKSEAVLIMFLPFACAHLCLALWQAKASKKKRLDMIRWLAAYHCSSDCYALAAEATEVGCSHLLNYCFVKASL